MRRLLYLFLVCLLFPVAVSGANYYWVGGAGNWSDLNHWRTTSGGAILPSVVPGPTDDVFFDANSGFTSGSNRVSVNVTANCRNITVSGASFAPVLGGSTLNIYGSSVWQSGMSVSATVYYQNTATPKTIRSNGAKFNTVYILETTSVSLLDEAEFGLSLYVNAGTFDTNNFDVTVGSFYANASTSGSGPRTLNLGSSNIYVTSNRFDTNSSQCTVNAGTSHIHFMSELSVGANPGFSGYGGQKFNNVTFENPASTIASISGAVTFNRVEYKGGGNLGGTMNELILAAGKTYNVARGSTVTINNKLSAGAACSTWLTLQSSTSGSAGTISMPAGATVDVAGAIIKDITATGGASFVVNNSVDNGGNTGWTFPSVTGTTLYWVGGAGDWGDKAHWSTTPGGTGGACVPGPADDVFFDAGSGFTDNSKTINIDAASYCKNITFSGSAVPPTMLSPFNANSLNIYGSSVWQSGMTVNVYYIYYQNTGVPKTITSNGVETLRAVVLRETTSVSLSDDFKTNSLSVDVGEFNTNNFDVTLSYGLLAASSRPKTLNLGSSNIYVGEIFDTNSGQTTVNAGTSHIHFKGDENTTENNFFAYDGQTFYDVSFENPKVEGVLQAYDASFNKVVFKGGGSIGGEIEMNELSLAAGKIYAFAEYETLTINQKLTAGTICEGWTTMRSSSEGSAAIIFMPATAIVDVQGILMSDIEATGDADFVASGSIDQGNNSGWTFTGGTSKDLYWVGGAGNWDDPLHWALTSGGAGGACVPGPGDDVFFDAGSGFTDDSKAVTIDASAYCRNITVAGTATPPAIGGKAEEEEEEEEEESANTLNIYGSSVWQSGMTVDVYYINYQDTGIPKTITSNGVTMGIVGVRFYETSSISLTDPLYIKSSLSQHAGTFNTNNFDVTMGSFLASTGRGVRTLNLGSSNIYITSNRFDTNSLQCTVNAGTSHIYFKGPASTLSAYQGQVFNNVSFENINSTGAIFSTGTGELTFNRAEFKGNGDLRGNNTFNELVLLSKTYRLEANKTQTVNKNLTMSGTPCEVLFVQSLTSGTHAKLNVLDGTVDFNFVNIKDINATGQTLHFGAQSTVANQNNINVTYDPYDPGALNDLGPDRICQPFYDNDPDTYMLSAVGYYGNEYTLYSWTKDGDDTVIGTDLTLDTRLFGYGTYTLEVIYTNGLTVTCRVSDDIVISMTPSIEITGPFNICIAEDPTTIANVSGLAGTNIKWYATSTSVTALPGTTVLSEGQVYYISQTIDNCESFRTPITIRFVNCDENNVKAVYINPNLRLRVANK